MKNNNSKLKILYLVLLFLILSFAFYTPVAAAVGQLVFTTEPRVVAPGAISDVLTVQTQDSSGAVAKMEETGDVSFVSSSPTGEFVNVSGEPVSTTMSRNSANRNFYYRDSTAGMPTLTVTVTARTAGTVWLATQTITVGDAGPPPGDDGGDIPTPPLAATGPSGSSGGGALSSHSSPAPVSQVVPSEPFKVGAGRPRLGSIHSPIIFRAESSGMIVPNMRYQWSFGDGGSAVGEEVGHVYDFSGEYVVVLNARGENGEVAVSRTTVVIVEPRVMISAPSADRVEVVNQSDRELNLGGWYISQGQTIFSFPTDTIVAASKKTIVPVNYLGFLPTTNPLLTLTFPDNTVAVTSTPAPSREELNALLFSLRELSIEVARLQVARRSTLVEPSIVRMEVVEPVMAVTTIVKQSPPTTSPPIFASMATIPVPKSPGFFTRIKQWFSK